MAVAIPWIALAVTVASTAASVYTQSEAGKTQEAGYNLQSEMAKLQQEQALSESERQAEIYEKSAAEEARQENLRQKAALSSILGGYGSQGLQMGGTPLLVYTESLTEAERQMKNMEWGAGEQTAGILRSGSSQALGYGLSSGLYSLYGQSARQSSLYGAGTTLLSGASTGMSNYYGYKKLITQV